MMILFPIGSKPVLHGYRTHHGQLLWLAWTFLVLAQKGQCPGKPRVPGQPGQLVTLILPQQNSWIFCWVMFTFCSQTLTVYLNDQELCSVARVQCISLSGRRGADKVNFGSLGPESTERHLQPPVLQTASFYWENSTRAKT